MGLVRFRLVGAVIGLTWAASLRGSMQQLTGPDSTFTFSGTFGIILRPASSSARCWAGSNTSAAPALSTGLLILTPLLIGILPNLVTAGLDPPR